MLRRLLALVTIAVLANACVDVHHGRLASTSGARGTKLVPIRHAETAEDRSGLVAELGHRTVG